jgi:hypothetical protein
MIIRILNITLASVLAFILASPVQAERAFYAAFSLVPGARALGSIVLSGATPVGVVRSDNTTYLGLSGGTTVNSSAVGANLLLYGASSGGSSGTAYLFGGNQTTGNILLQITNASAETRFLNSSSGTMWSINNSGNLVQDATNGGDIVFARANTGVRNTVVTGIGAAGSASADATVLTSAFTNITSGTATQGVRLQGFPVGMVVAVRNQSATTFLVYPPTGGNILGYGTDAAASIAVNATIWCFVNTATQLACSEAPNA